MEKNLIQNLKSIFTQYKWRFFKATTMVLISNLLLVGNPLVFRHALNILNKSSVANSQQPASSPLNLVWPWVVVLLCIALLASTFKYLMRMEFMQLSRDVELEIREKLFSKIQNQSRAFFGNHSIGELLSRLTNDISSYRELLGFALMYPLFCITLIVPGVAALFMISPQLTMLSLIPIALIPVINILLRNPIYQASHAVQATLAEMSSSVQETFAGIRVVKGYGIEKMMSQKFDALCLRFLSENFRLSWIQGIAFPLFALITKLTTLALVVLSGYIILLAWGKLTTADFLSFMWIQSYIFFPVIMLGWVLPIYQRGRAAYSRIVGIYDEPIEVVDNLKSKIKIHQNADITFKNFTFNYPNVDQPAIANLSLKIKGGSFVGITGPLGAGKSTLFHVLGREYEIPKNKVFINGDEIHKFSLKAIHQGMITVEQSSFLFSRTVADNVRFARSEATQEEVQTAAEFADLHETVMGFSSQYETVVGERGVTLSGGQKQRVAMARAFLVHRSILLLDDIFSAVDAATERRIFNSIRRHFKGKTVLLITQRVSILEQMDRVLFMSKGKLIEDGIPEVLAKQKGHYAALVELQKYGISNGN